MGEERNKKEVEIEEGQRWPDLPKAPDSAFQLKRFLLFINRKGIATRSDLLRIVGSSTQLNSWLRDLIGRFGLVEEIREDGRRFYRKTLEGRAMEQVVTDKWYYVKLLLTLYSQNRRIPYSEQPKQTYS